MGSAHATPQTDADALQAPRQILGTRDAIRAALAGFGGNVAVMIAREPDWMVARGLLLPPEEGDSPRTVTLQVPGNAMDASWFNAPVFVHIDRTEGVWSFRSVVRNVIDGVVTADQPAELRPFPPPWPGVERRAVSPAGEEATPFRRVAFQEHTDPATQKIFQSVTGADLQLRSHSLGTRINHEGRMAGLIAMLVREETLALTVAGHCTVHPVRFKRVGRPDGKWGLCAFFLSTPPPGLRTGTGVFITGVVGTEIYTMRVVVEAVGGEKLVLVSDPKAIYRYQRRAACRYRLLRGDVGVEVATEHGQTGEYDVADISLTGLGLIYRKGYLPAPPEVITMRLTIADLQSLDLQGQCACRLGGEGDEPVKLGVQLVDVDPRRLRIIGRLIQKLGQPV